MGEQEGRFRRWWAARRARAEARAREREERAWAEQARRGWGIDLPQLSARETGPVRAIVSGLGSRLGWGGLLLFGLLLVLVVGTWALRMGPALGLWGSGPSFASGLRPPFELAYPVAGPSRLTHGFGDPRPGGRSHEGEDIPAAKGTTVVAAADGEVIRLRGGLGDVCCSIFLRHEGGWVTRYLHLDNDSPGTDDGKGLGVAPGLRLGSEVEAGQVIGWVGDSGNAEETGAHLHFELRHPDGHAIDPFPALLAAVLADPKGHARVRVPAFRVGDLEH